jgi:CRISPR-associated protein Csd1
MILSRLNEQYNRLLTRFNETGSRPVCLVPSFGFSDEKIGYLLVLNEQGHLMDVIPNRVQVRKGKKVQDEDRRMRVPCAFGRSGKFTEKAFNEGKNISFFLWDKPEFLLGVTLEGKKVKKADLPFRAFKAKQKALVGNADDKGLKAVLAFLEGWTPERFEGDGRFNPEMLTSNFSFKLDGDLGIVAERERAVEIWRQYWRTQQNSIERQCLITGKIAPLAETHPMLKVTGGQTSGVAIVSFNERAYESFGKIQGDNAPVSEEAAFAYTTALNYLLRRENDHCLSISDTSTVFWAQSDDTQQEALAVDVFSAMLNPPPEDDGEAKQIRLSLEKIAQGRPFQDIAPDVDPSTRFFVLGLAPNAARLSIRYWLDSSIGELGQCLSEHWADMQITPLPWKAEHPPSVWRCLIETAPLNKTENIAPQLSGEWLRSILTGQRYPRQFLTQIVQRLRADGDISGMRAALIKAVLHRDHRKGFTKEAIPMSLEIEGSPLAYRLGCLFAVLEQAQRGALGDVNASIVDRYYGTASSVPYSVFPRLIAGCQNHLSKIRKSKPGYAVNIDKALGGIMVSLPTTFPKQLTIEQQGQFTVGYYHQRQAFFAKKGDVPETESTPSN